MVRNMSPANLVSEETGVLVDSEELSGTSKWALINYVESSASALGLAEQAMSGGY